MVYGKSQLNEETILCLLDEMSDDSKNYIVDRDEMYQDSRSNHCGCVLYGTDAALWADSFCICRI
jgi:hypothetical protein